MHAPNGQLDGVAKLVTHHFDLDQMEQAYDVFAAAADNGALKVVLDAVPRYRRRMAASVRRSQARPVTPIRAGCARSASTCWGSPERASR